MKKIFVLVMLVGIMFLTGCGKDNAESVFKDFTNKINKLNSYTIKGVLNVKNNNNTYNYDVEVNYMSKDKFRVTLVNTANNHEQVILRNDDGVFVLTPSLNKSFKFQSDWPYNNSQVYILGSIVDDLNKDKETAKEEIDGKYVFTSKVTYPNNNKLVSQKVIVTKDLFVESVEVLNSEGNVEMKFTVNSTDYSPTFDESYFEVNSIINNTNNNSLNGDNKKENNNNGNNTQNDGTNSNSNISENNSTDTTNSETCDSNTNTTCKKENNTATNQSSNVKSYSVKPITMTMNGLEDVETDTSEKVTPTATLEDVIYPLYLPNGTVLKDQEKVSKTDGERVILTFAGDKGFTLVEETATRETEFTIIPTYGEPGLINDTVGAITDNSLNWISNGVEYYMVSDVMNTIELLDVANSINVTAVANLK
ncbi:MAG: outer membrane lipoprotein carrier protein LolA [Bacilli bacterium]|nr:outer membrane lipoprotein carrier protein LolA [Bacilli bacterium]